MGTEENTNDNTATLDHHQNGVSDANASNAKVARARKRLQKKKQQKKRKGNAGDNAMDEENDHKVALKQEEDTDILMSDDIKVKVEVQYVGDSLETQPESAALASAFSDVFGAFLTPEELLAPKKLEGSDKTAPNTTNPTTTTTSSAFIAPKDSFAVDSDNENDDDENDGKPKQSKKALKRMSRLTIAELKQLVTRPDVVEVWDTTATDPRTLVFLKGYRNVVPVPRHWCQKRKYLQGKRGIEKPPFKLPSFIEATGIQKMREAYQAKDDEKRAKQKQRERMAPKMGRIDINYQVLHDAFFKYQTKPTTTIHGDLYYEGKEFEVSLKAKRPGNISEDLRNALGMEKHSPPPWLTNMQRYGPPPSYPNIRISGVNAPLPAGCGYGFAPGEWGRPPVDEQGRPLFGGNPFDPPGSESTAEESRDHYKRWGQIEDDLVSEDENEDEPEDETEVGGGGGGGGGDGTETTTPSILQGSFPAGIATPAGGLDSVVALGMQTPASGSIDLRKAFRTGKDTPAEEGDQQLFQVIQEQQAAIGGAAFGSDKTYNMQSVSQLMSKEKDKRKEPSDRVQVSLNPDELENMDEAILKQKYAQQIQVDQGGDNDDEEGPRNKRLREQRFKF